MSTKEKTETEADAPKGSKKKLFLILGVVLVAAAGAAYFFLFAGSAEAETPAPEHGGYVALEPIAVNLAGGGYLKVGITLEITTDAAGGGHGGPRSTAPRPTTRSSRPSPRRRPPT
jgi:flagellar FliL protein